MEKAQAAESSKSEPKSEGEVNVATDSSKVAGVEALVGTEAHEAATSDDNQARLS